MTLHTFGDSHALYAWKDCNNVITNCLGPILCYSFGVDKLKRCDISKFNTKDGDTVIFSFGEIDCRCHVYRYISFNSYTKIIDGLISNYIDAIKVNLNTCKTSFKNICIYNIVPPFQKANTIENKQYPYLGSDEERKKYVLYFNSHIKKKCIENNWIFVDIYDEYIDKNGFLNKNLSDGHVHINNNKYLQQFINKYL